jgi:protein-S-isoprenylcysteine O-methyltransferase Ste14
MAGVFLSPLADRGSLAGESIGGYVAGSTLLVLGLLLLVGGAVKLGRSLSPLPTPRPAQALVTDGPFRLVRHPMYGGGILIALGWTIVFATLVGLAFTLGLTLFLALKARREEAWLVESVEGYDAYREQTTRMLVPFVY